MIAPGENSGGMLAPVAVERRLERLALVDMPNDVQDAGPLERGAELLRRAGLTVSIVSRSPARITGGRKLVERDGISTYEDAFALWQDARGAYYAGRAGANVGDRCGPGELDEALAFLQRAYGEPHAAGR